jgi:hypothetical protein
LRERRRGQDQIQEHTGDELDHRFVALRFVGAPGGVMSGGAMFVATKLVGVVGLIVSVVGGGFLPIANAGLATKLNDNSRAAVLI